MISQISGKIVNKKDSSVYIEINGICYEVLLPPIVMNTLEKNIGDDGKVSLVTFHYYQTDPSKSIPVLIGFMNEVEKEFFEQFITVSGIGPKAACRALSIPFSIIADAIDRGDVSFLKTLPGIGEQKSKEIVAKLQGKVGKVGLIQDRDVRPTKVKEDIKQEALAVLIQLQYKKKEAEQMIEKALVRNPDVKDSEELLNEVYRQKTSEG